MSEKDKTIEEVKTHLLNMVYNSPTPREFAEAYRILRDLELTEARDKRDAEYYALQIERERLSSPLEAQQTNA